MRLLLIVVSLHGATASAVDCGTKAASHPDTVAVRGGNITGGRQSIVGGGAAAAHSWPWQVFISSKHGYMWNECGGTVLNQRWILTAAHCVDDKGSTDMSDSAWVEKQRAAIKFIITGMHNMKTINTGGSPQQQRCNAAKLVIHPKWPGSQATHKGANMDNDIALIKLDCSLHWTDTVRPACLPDKADSFYTKGENVVLTGWGYLGESGVQPDELQQVVVEVEGEAAAPYTHPQGHVIHVAKGALGSCKADSGGPANALRGGKWVVAGITSYGTAGSDLKYCDSKDGISGYTHVPHYVDWIQGHIDDLS